MSAASRSDEKAIMMKPKSSGRPSTPPPYTLTGAPSLVYIPLNGAFPRDGAYSFAFFTCDSRRVPPCGSSSSNPAHDASSTAADNIVCIFFIVVRFVICSSRPRNRPFSWMAPRFFASRPQNRPFSWMGWKVGPCERAKHSPLSCEASHMARPSGAQCLFSVSLISTLPSLYFLKNYFIF